MADEVGSHPAWIEVAHHKYDALGIIDHGRLERLINDLPDPKAQYPQIVTFMGDVRKRSILADLFSDSASSPSLMSTDRSVVDLHMDASTGTSRYPALFADIESRLSVSPRTERQKIYKQSRRGVKTSQILWQDEPGTTLRTIIARVVIPFSDVICLFADDIGGVDAACNHLITWPCADRTASSVFQQFQPHVILITSETRDAKIKRMQDDTITERLRKADFPCSAVTIVHLPILVSGEVMKYVRPYMVKMRQNRVDRHLQFSSPNLLWLFNEALAHAARTRALPFDFISAWYASRPASPALIDHLTAFWNLAREERMTMEQIGAIIASSLRVEAYYLSSHVFSARDVYDTVYASIVEQALMRTAEVERALLAHPTKQLPYVRRFMVDPIERRFIDVSNTELTTALETHGQMWSRQNSQAAWIRKLSNHICPFCLHRPSEHALQCQHIICDTCVARKGELLMSREYFYAIRRCPLCQTPSTLEVQLKPPTAGVRIATFDGGGVRGVLLLRILYALQKKMGVENPVQDFIDLLFGTSAGGLIVLGLRHLPVEECLARFQTLAGQIFDRTDAASCAAVSTIRMCIALLRHDAKYGADRLRTALRTCLHAPGDETRVFGYQDTGPSSCKYGVTATSQDSRVTWLITNYNGEDRGKVEQSYKRLRCADPDQEPLLFEAAYATAAAPTYFPLIKIDGKLLQDGAMRYNNPLLIAYTESRRMWPESTIDRIISFGTGVAKPIGQVARTTPSSSIRRLLQFLKDLATEKLDPEIGYRLARDSMDDAAKRSCTRLDVNICGTLPGIDAAYEMDRMMALDLQDHVLEDEVHRLHFDLIASSFFFELTKRPEHDDTTNMYFCNGTIRVRGNPQSVVGSLQKIDTTGVFHFCKGGDDEEDPTGPGEAAGATEFLGSFTCCDALCTECGRFHQIVKFMVSHLQKDRISILLSSPGGQTRQISGFPKSMSWFVEQQRLRQPFRPQTSYGVCPCTEAPPSTTISENLNSPPIETLYCAADRYDAADRSQLGKRISAEVISTRAKKRRMMNAAHPPLLSLRGSLGTWDDSEVVAPTVLPAPKIS